MDASNDAVRVAFIVNPIGRLSLLLGGPCIARFFEFVPREEQGPTRDLWIRWETSKKCGEEYVELVFVARTRRPRRPRRARRNRQGTEQETIGRSGPLNEPARIMLKFLEIQSLVDCELLGHNPNGDGTNPVVGRLRGSVESPSYDWDRMEALCAQFELGRKA